MLKYHISVVDPSVGLREGLSVKNAGSLVHCEGQRLDS